MIENLHLLLAKYDSMEDCKWDYFFAVLLYCRGYSWDSFEKVQKSGFLTYSSFQFDSSLGKL